MNESRAGGIRRHVEKLEIPRNRGETQGCAHYLISSTGVLHATGAMDEDSRLGPEPPTPQEEQ
jgi:hypothetical protein